MEDAYALKGYNIHEAEKESKRQERIVFSRFIKLIFNV